MSCTIMGQREDHQETAPGPPGYAEAFGFISVEEAEAMKTTCIHGSKLVGGK